MNAIELEQLKNNLAIKIGVLELKIKREEINDDTSMELVKIFRDYEENGTTIEELKLLSEDVKLALS